MGITRDGRRTAMMQNNVETRLQQGIAQGIFQEEVAKDINCLLKIVGDKKLELAELQTNYEQICKELADYKRIYHDAVAAQQREFKRNERYSDIKRSTAFVFCMFIIVLLSTIICKFIF